MDIEEELVGSGVMVMVMVQGLLSDRLIFHESQVSYPNQVTRARQRFCQGLDTGRGRKLSENARVRCGDLPH